MSVGLRQKQNSIVVDERYISAPVLLKPPSLSGSEELDNCRRYFSSINPSVYNTYLKSKEKSYLFGEGARKKKVTIFQKMWIDKLTITETFMFVT